MTAGSRVRTGGAVCVAAGLFGFAGHGYLALTTTEGGAAFGFPMPVSGAVALQMGLGLVPAVLIVGLLALRRCRALPDTPRARFGYYGAIVALAGLTSVGGIAVTTTRSAPGGGQTVFGVVYAGYVVLLGGCLLLVGLEVARRGPWIGWPRRLPFVLGSWLVIPVLPSLAVGFRAASWVIAGWCALFAALGLVLMREGRRVGDQPDGRRRASTSARAAAVATWIYVAGFGGAAIPATAYLLHTGTLPDFLGVFTMFGGPLSQQLTIGARAAALVAFFLVTLLAGWAAWLLWNGSRTGALLTFVLLPIEAAFWTVFFLPLPWVTGAARLILVARAWRSLDRPGRGIRTRPRAGSTSS